MESSICRSRRPIPRARARVLLLAAVLAMAGPAARAGTEGAKGAAQAKLVEGVGLLKDRRYREALDCFKQAYGLVPSPLINYDFGLAYLGMGDDARALESFETFLDRALDAPADKRRKAEGYRNDLRGRVAIVAVGADVDASELAVDGRSLGRVSCPRRLYLAPGSHGVVARVGPGGPTYAATVTCGPGQTADLEVRLAHAPAARPPATLAGSAAAGAALAPSLPAPAAPALAGESARPDVVEAHGTPEESTFKRPFGTWALPVAALGLASTGVGLAFGVMARNEGDAVTDDSVNRRDFRPAIESEGLHDQHLGELFLSIGAAALVAGVSVYLLTRHRQDGHGPSPEGTP
jgi:hypothetical protein